MDSNTFQLYHGIIQLFVTTIGAVIAGYVAIRIASITANSKISADNSNATRQLSADTAESVDKIHTAVNSERTAMLAKIEALSTEIIALVQDNKDLKAKNDKPM